MLLLSQALEEMRHEKAKTEHAAADAAHKASEALKQSQAENEDLTQQLARKNEENSKLDAKLSQMEMANLVVEKKFKQWNEAFEIERQKNIVQMKKLEAMYERMKGEREELMDVIHGKDEEIKNLRIKLSTQDHLLN